MRILLPLCLTALLISGCGQPAAPTTADVAAAPPPVAPAQPAATASGALAIPAASNRVVATVLGQPVRGADCLSPSRGIGSVDVGFHSLVLAMLIDDFSKTRSWDLTQPEIDAFWVTLKAAATRARGTPESAEPLREPTFDEEAAQVELRLVRQQLAVADLPLLEKLSLQGRERSCERALELKSAAATVAYRELLPLRVEAALYQAYGGKVVARQIGIEAAGAHQELAKAAEASGKLVIHDEALRQAFWRRIQDALGGLEVPPERVDFSLPGWLQVTALAPPQPATQPTPEQVPAAEPLAASVGGPGILASFAGVWRTNSELRPSESLPEGGKFTSQEVTRPALKGRYLLSRELSAPDGRRSLWLMTWDAERRVAPFWLFDSEGLFGARWELTWDADSHTASGQSIELPPGWTSHGTNQFPDRETILVDYWIKDATGKMQSAARAQKSRQPEDAAPAVLAEWSQAARRSNRLGELQVLDELIGTWDAVTVLRPAEWTPQESRMTSVVTRKWILNDQVVYDMSTHSSGEQSLALFGVDVQSREYVTWWFNSEGQRSATRGRWDASARTFAFHTEPEDGRVTRSTVRLISPDRHEWQIKVTDGAGKVYFDSTITLTRRSGPASAP